MPRSVTLSGISRNRATIRGHAPITDLMTPAETPGDRSDQALGRSRRHRRAKGDKGVALVEFAIVMPLLFLIIFGVIEFGNAFFQSSDVRHGARETSRLVAVNYDPTIPSACSSVAAPNQQSCAIIVEACLRMDAGSATTVSFTSTGKAVGDTATITVSKPLQTLTGFLDSFIGGKTLSSAIDTRLELNGTWTNYSRTCT